MLKILIVDDEPFFLDFLTQYISWTDFQAEVLGTKLNGLSALNFLQSHPVDIVFTDIKMPIMNGLELISEASEKYPETQFVVLSSYSDFHMVGDAYKLGAKEYLLKSEITKEQLAGVLARCEEKRRKVSESEQKRAEQQSMFLELSREVNRLERMMYRNRYTIRKAFFNSAIDRGVSDQALMEEKQGRNLEHLAPPAALMLVKVREYRTIAQSFWENDHSTLEFALTNVLEEEASFWPAISVFGRREGEFVILLPKGGSEHREKLQFLYKKVVSALENFLSIQALVSVSGQDEEHGGIHALYGQALEAQANNFMLGNDQLLFFDKENEPSVLPSSRLWYQKNLLDQFQHLLTRGDISGLQNALPSFQIPAGTYTKEQIKEIREHFLKYSAAILAYLERIHGTERALQKALYFKQCLFENGTLREYNEWLSEMVTVLMQLDFNSTNLVRRAKRYVKDHYDEELNLSVIADQVGVNPSYLSRAFSEAEGEGLMLYINKIRISAATELLSTTTLRLYEVSEKVGYKNVEHFSRMFKKIMGKPPREFSATLGG